MASLFTKIFNGEIPGKIVYQDELCGVLVDIQPQAPTHLLVIPKKEIVSVHHADETDQKLLGHLVLVAARMARELGVAEDGYRLIINTGRDGGQSVPHIHVHLLAGRPLHWPPG